MAEKGQEILALIPAIGDDKIDKVIALAKIDAAGAKQAARDYIKANQEPFGDYSADGSDAKTDDESFITNANLALIRIAAADRILAFIQSKLDALDDLNDADNLASVTAIAKATGLVNLAGAHAEVAKFTEANIDEDAVKALEHATPTKLKALQEAAAKQLANHIQTQLPDADKTKAEQLAVLVTTEKDSLDGKADAIAAQIGGVITADMVKGLKHCPDAEYQVLQTAAADKVAAFIQTKLATTDDEKRMALALLSKDPLDLTTDAANIEKLDADIDAAMVQALGKTSDAVRQQLREAAANQTADFIKGKLIGHGDKGVLEDLATKDAAIFITPQNQAALGTVHADIKPEMVQALTNCTNYAELQQAAAKVVVEHKLDTDIANATADDLQAFAEAADHTGLPDAGIQKLITPQLMASYKAQDPGDLQDQQKQAAKAALIKRIKASNNPDALLAITTSNNLTDIKTVLLARASFEFDDDPRADVAARGRLRAKLDAADLNGYQKAAQETAAQILSDKINAEVDVVNGDIVETMQLFNAFIEAPSATNGVSLWDDRGPHLLTLLGLDRATPQKKGEIEQLVKALSDNQDEIKKVRKTIAQRAINLKLKDPSVSAADKVKLIENFDRYIADGTLGAEFDGGHLSTALSGATLLDAQDTQNIKIEIFDQHLREHLKAHPSQQAHLQVLVRFKPNTEQGQIRDALKGMKDDIGLGGLTVDKIDAQLLTDESIGILHAEWTRDLNLIEDAATLGVSLDIAAPIQTLSDKKDAALQSREAKFKDVLSDPSQTEAELEETIKELNTHLEDKDKVPDAELKDKALHLRASNLAKLIYGDKNDPSKELAIYQELQKNPTALTTDRVAALASAYTNSGTTSHGADTLYGIMNTVATANPNIPRPNDADIKRLGFRNLSMHIFGTEQYADQLAKAGAQAPQAASPYHGVGVNTFQADITALLNADYDNQPPFDEAGRQAALDRIDIAVAAELAHDNPQNLPELPYHGDAGKRDKYVANADINAASHYISTHKDQTFPRLSRNYNDEQRAFKRAHKRLEEDYKASMEKANKDAGRGFYSLSGRGHQARAAIAGDIAVALPRNVGAFVLGLAANAGTLFSVNLFKDARKFLYSTAPGIHSFGSEREMLAHTQEMLKAMQNEHASIIHKAFIDNQREHIEKSTQALDVATNNLHQRLWEIQKRIRALPEDAQASDIKEMRKALVKKETAVKAELDSIKNLHETLKETSKLLEERKDITSYGFEHLESQVYQASDRAKFLNMGTARIDTDGNTGVAIRQQSAIGASDPTLKGVKAGQDIKAEFIGHRYRIDVGSNRYKHINIEQSVDNKSFRLVSDTNLTYDVNGKNPQKIKDYNVQDAEHDAKAVMQMARLALNCKTEAELLKDPLIVSGKNDMQKKLAMASLFLVAEELGLKLDDRHIKCTTPGYNKAKAMEAANDKPAAGGHQSIEPFATLAQKETRKMSEKRKGTPEDLSHHTKKGKAHLKSLQGKAEKEEKHSDLDHSKPTGLGRGGR